MTKNQPTVDRFLEKVSVDPESGCWPFISSISKSGNGRFFYEGKCRDAYRLSYEFFKGPILPRLHLHHVCENRRCVNPKHLMPVTPKEHFAQLTPHHIAYKNAHKTECANGHPFTLKNIKRCDLKRNRRTCLICSRKSARDCQRRRRTKGGIK